MRTGYGTAQPASEVPLTLPSNELAVAAALVLEAVADAMAAVASRSGPLGISIRGLFDNTGRLTTYAASSGTSAAQGSERWI